MTALKMPPAPLRQVRMIRPISNYLKFGLKKLKFIRWSFDLFVSGRLGSHHALLLELLLADFLGARRLGGAGDGDLALGEDDLDVARRGHVGVDATVGTVGAAALLGGGIDLENIDYIKKG